MRVGLIGEQPHIAGTVAGLLCAEIAVDQRQQLRVVPCLPGGEQPWKRKTFQTADLVITTNQSHRRIAIEQGGMVPADVYVVRSGPDLERLTVYPPTLPGVRASATWSSTWVRSASRTGSTI